MTRYVKFKGPYLPSFDFRVLQMFCIWQNIMKISSWLMLLEMGYMIIEKDFEISNMTRYVKFKVPHLPSFDFRVPQMFCIWKNIIKLSLISWWMWINMGNRMRDKDFEFQTWHTMWSSRLNIFLFLPSGSSKVLYLKDYSQIIKNSMINIIRNGE